MNVLKFALALNNKSEEKKFSHNNFLFIFWLKFVFFIFLELYFSGEWEKWGIPERKPTTQSGVKIKQATPQPATLNKPLLSASALPFLVFLWVKKILASFHSCGSLKSVLDLL